MSATSARIAAPHKSQVQSALAVGMARAAMKAGGAGTLADRINSSPATITRAMAGTHLPEFHTAFASVLVEPSALDEVGALYGVRVVPLDAVCTSDVRSSSTLVGLLAKVIEAEADGAIDHAELLAMEADIRAVRAMCDRKLARIGGLRGLERVA